MKGFWMVQLCSMWSLGAQPSHRGGRGMLRSSAYDCTGGPYLARPGLQLPDSYNVTTIRPRPRHTVAIRRLHFLTWQPLPSLRRYPRSGPNPSQHRAPFGLMGGCFARPRTAPPATNTDGSPRPDNRFSRLEAASDVLSVAKPTESAASLFLRLPMLHAYIAYRACIYDYV